MAGLEDILKVLPIDQIAEKLGVDPQTASKAVLEGGGAILGGLQRNAETPDGASAIEAALGKHQGLGDSVDLDKVDTADGAKILKHVFGDDAGEVAQKLTDEPKTAGIDFGKLLPVLAPIILGLLAKNQSSSSAPAASEQSGGGIFDVIGGLLGGGQGGGLGGLLGGSGGGLDLGGILGGLLGGKK